MRYAPIASDARVVQRSKTLLGERYLEITSGSRGAPRLAEGGRLPDGQVAETNELDELKKRAPDNWYIEANEARDLGLVLDVI